MTLSIEVRMDSPNGPKIVVHGLAARSDQAQADADQAEIYAAIPQGWDVDWGSEVRTSTGGWAWPLVSA